VGPGQANQGMAAGGLQAAPEGSGVGAEHRALPPGADQPLPGGGKAGGAGEVAETQPYGKGLLGGQGRLLRAARKIII